MLEHSSTLKDNLQQAHSEVWPLKGMPLNPKPPWFIRDLTMTGTG